MGDRDDLQLDPPDNIFIAIARIGAIVACVVTWLLVTTTITGAPR